MYIVQKDFDLTNKDEAVKFLLSMYNFGEELGGIAKKLDSEKKGHLEDAVVMTKNMTSLTAATKAANAASANEKRSTGRSKGNLPEIAEEDSGVFDADDVHEYLERYEYKFEYVLFGVGVYFHAGILIHLADGVFTSTLMLQQYPTSTKMITDT